MRLRLLGGARPARPPPGASRLARARPPPKACGVPLRCESNSLRSNKYRLRSSMRITTAQGFPQAERPPVRSLGYRLSACARPPSLREGSRRPVWPFGGGLRAAPSGYFLIPRRGTMPPPSLRSGFAALRVELRRFVGICARRWPFPV